MTDHTPAEDVLRSLALLTQPLNEATAAIAEAAQQQPMLPETLVVIRMLLRPLVEAIEAVKGAALAAQAAIAAAERRQAGQASAPPPSGSIH